MSWSITINDLDEVDNLPESVILNAAGDNRVYYDDILGAFQLAKSRGMVSATVSGGRTPSPYGGPDTVVIAITGFDSHAQGHAVPPVQRHDFNAAMLETIYAGPDHKEGDIVPGWGDRPLNEREAEMLNALESYDE